MRYTHQLSAGIALAATTSAFLLPPTITQADSDIVSILPFEEAIAINDHLVEVNCPGCLVAIDENEGNAYFSQIENALRLNFSVALNDQADRLLLNDVQVYPFNPGFPNSVEMLSAPQLVKSPEGHVAYVSTATVGYSIVVSRPAIQSDNEQMNLVLVKVEIVSVADMPVGEIPAVVVKMLETPSGKLMIGDTELISVPSRVSVPSGSKKQCSTGLCKWKAVLAEKLSKVKGCAGKNRHSQGRHGAGIRPHARPHGPGHRMHGHHHKSGGFARFLRSIVLHVFIPIMIGVVVGVTTSLVGMVVGHLIVFVWRTLFRRGQRGQCRRVQEVVVEAGEEKGFLEPQGPPPTYEEAPAYEEAVVDEKASA